MAKLGTICTPPFLFGKRHRKTALQDGAFGASARCGVKPKLATGGLPAQTRKGYSQRCSIRWLTHVPHGSGEHAAEQERHQARTPYIARSTRTLRWARRAKQTASINRDACCIRKVLVFRAPPHDKSTGTFPKHPGALLRKNNEKGNLASPKTTAVHKKNSPSLLPLLTRENSSEYVNQEGRAAGGDSGIAGWTPGSFVSGAVAAALKVATASVPGR